MLDDDVDEVIGSRLAIHRSDLCNNFSNLTRHVDSAMSDKSIPLYQQHNIYTAYSILLLGYATAHRPVLDVFSFREDVCLSNGILSINDKASSESTETRTIWLCKTAIIQFKNYLKHLEQLAIHLQQLKFNITTAREIAAIIKPAEADKQVIPLFFYLTCEYRVITARPVDLTGKLGYEWPYPFNHNRHFMETGLAEEGIPSPLIDLVMGHQSEYYHFLGKNTSWSANEAGDELRAAIERLLVKHGITPLFGLRAEHKEYVAPVKATVNEAFGYLRRQEVRQKEHIELTRKVCSYMHEEVARAGGIRIFLSDKKREDKTLCCLLDNVVPSGCSQRESIDIATNVLLELANKEPTIEYYPKRLLVAESGPFESRWLSRYRAAKILRDQFIERSIDEYDGSRDESVEVAWSYVVFSSVAMTGMHRKEWVKYLLDMGPGEICKIKNWVYFIDIWVSESKPKRNPEYHAPDWRWHPDSFTKVLILDLLRKFSKKQIKKYSPEKTCMHFYELSNTLGVRCAHEKVINKVCDIFEPFWRFYFPQYINDIFRNKQKNTPLPQRSLARLLYGTKLSAYTETDTKYRRSLLPKMESGCIDMDALGYLTIVNSIFNQAESVKGSSLGGAKSKKRAYVEDRLLELHEVYALPDVAEQLTTWVIHMCRHGVTVQKKPPISTIKKYYGYIARPFVLLMQGRSLDGMSPEEVTRVFKTIVNVNHDRNSNKADSRSDVLRELNNFHKSIVRYGTADIDELDWDSISEGVKFRVARKANANIVTAEEYFHCLDLIPNNMIGFDEYQRNWPSLFLIFGYRFALRVGEIRRLRMQDVQVHDGKILLQVQNTREGEAKSATSIRQLPMLGELSDSELDVVEQHLRIMKGKHGVGLNSPLFPGFGTKDGLLDRNLIYSNVHALLKHVTGDPRVVFHHLRHSFLTTQYIMNFMTIAYRVKEQIKGQRLKSNDDPCKTLIGDGVVSIFRQHALSRYAGHKDISTTVQSYLHVVDDVATAYAEVVPCPKMTLTDLSKITGMKEKTLKNRLKNNKSIDMKRYSAMDALRTIQIRDEIEKYDYRLEKFPRKFEFKNPEKYDRLVSWHRALLEHGVLGDSVEFAGYLYSIKPEVMQDIATIGLRIKEETFFDGYFTEAGRKKGHRIAPNTTYDSDLEGLIRTVELLMAVGKTRNVLLEGVEVWIRSFRRDEKGYCLVVNSNDDLEGFLNAAALLGCESESFVATKHPRFFELNTNEGYKEKLSLLDASKLGIKVTRKSVVRAMDKGIGIERYDFLRITEKRIDGVRFHMKTIKALSYAFNMSAIMMKTS